MWGEQNTVHYRQPLLVGVSMSVGESLSDVGKPRTFSRELIFESRLTLPFLNNRTWYSRVIRPIVSCVMQGLNTKTIEYTSLFLLFFHFLFMGYKMKIYTFDNDLYFPHLLIWCMSYKIWCNCSGSYLLVTKTS